MSCPEISGADHDIWTLHAPADDDLLLTTFHSDGDAQAVLTGPDGQTCFLGPYPADCAAAVAGIYTIDVHLYFAEGTASYVLGIESYEHPSTCATLGTDFFSVDSPGVEGDLPVGEPGDCYQFDGTPGAKLRVVTSSSGDVRGMVRNAAGEGTCYLQNGNGAECTLTGDGPYRFFMTEMYAAASTYRVHLIRLGDPAGCDPLAVGSFGPLDPAQLDEGRLAAGVLHCDAITASAGEHLVQLVNDGDVSWSVRDSTGTVICEKWGSGPHCDFPADGTYSLWLQNGDNWGDPVAYHAAVIALASTRGCADPVGTNWDQPTISIPLESPVQVDCQPFTAAPGERVIAYTYDGGWITDRTGARICDGTGDSDEDGCVLPGTGPYRFIATEGSSFHDTAPIQIQIRRLSAAAGCPVVAPGTFGKPSADPLADIRCRSLTVPAAGRYLVRAVDDENYQRWLRVYDADGKRVCESDWCDFPAAGTYTMVINGGVPTITEGAYSAVLLAAAGPGCTPVSDQGASGAAYQGSFTGPGQVDCLQLPSPAGSRVAALLPSNATGVSYPDLLIVDATGAYVCDTYSATYSGCDLTGTAPFRVLVNAREDYVSGDYLLAFQRATDVAGCANLPQGAIGATTGASVSFSGGRFAACFAIPANAHSAHEIATFVRTAGTGRAKLSVYGPNGNLVCFTSLAGSGFDTCDFAPGAGYTAVLVADAGTATYRVTRKDASPGGANCQAVGSTTIGGKPSGGTITGRDDLRCYRITAAAADSYWVGVRSTGVNGRYFVTDAAGNAVSCLNYASPCRVSGSVAYQVFVWGNTDGPAVAYQLDTWKLGSVGHLPAECPLVPTSAYGFGPLTGTLTDDKPAVCLAVPVFMYDEFVVAVTNTEGGDAVPDPYLITTTDPIHACSYAEGGRGCQAGNRQRTDTELFIIYPDHTTGRFPFHAEVSCREPLCGANTFSVGSVTPTSAAAGSRATIVLHGTSLNLKDTVQLTRTAQAPIEATVRSVSADRTTLTADVDLPAAGLGAWTVAVTSFSTAAATLPDAFTVTPVPLKALKAPAITGTVRVGVTVRAATGTWTPAATSYAYQWYASGVAIKGATGSAYAVPAAVRGKRLSVTVTAKRSGLPNGVASSPTVLVGTGVAPKATKAPAITGTVRKGRTVKVSLGSWTPKPEAYRYEWRLNGKAIRGATRSSLKLTSSMVGKSLTVVVTAKRSGHGDGKATSKAVKVKK